MVFSIMARWNWKGARELEALAKGSGKTRELMTAIGMLYLSDMHKRFVSFSKGGGTWAKLDAKTVRRKGRTSVGTKVTVNTKKTGGKTAILVDTGAALP